MIIINLYSTVILGATLHKEGIEKECLKSEKNALDLRELAGLISHPGFEFLFVFFKRTPILSQTNFTTA